MKKIKTKSKYGSPETISVSKSLGSSWGKSPIGITQLLRDTGTDYWKSKRKKVDKVI